ncbi:MAG: VanZ family protein [Bacteroidales bacterium]
MIHFLKKYLPTLLLISCIAFLSTANFSDMPIQPTLPYMDKIVHFLMYFGLSFIFLEDEISPSKPRRLYGKYMLRAFLFATFIGGAFELVQLFLVEGRAGDWMDFAANCTGALFGVLTGYVILPHLSQLLFKIKRGN